MIKVLSTCEFHACSQTCDVQWKLWRMESDFMDASFPHMSLEAVFKAEMFFRVIQRLLLFTAMWTLNSCSCYISDLDAGWKKSQNLLFSQVCLCYLAFFKVFSCSLSSFPLNPLILLPFGFCLSLPRLQKDGSILACLRNRKTKRKWTRRDIWFSSRQLVYILRSLSSLRPIHLSASVLNISTPASPILLFLLSMSASDFQLSPH